MQTFLMDVYIDIAPRHRAWVQDFSPYLPGCERLENALFPWDEVTETQLARQQQEEAANELEQNVVEIRTADSASSLRPKKDYGVRFPMELQNMAELKKFMESSLA